MELYDTIIIGGGPAGLTAAIYARRAGMSTLLLEKRYAGGQITATHMLDNYPGFPGGVSGMDFALGLHEPATALGTEFITSEAASIALQDGCFHVRRENDDHIGKTVVLAPGGTPRKLGIPGEDTFSGRGVSYCATCDGAFFRNMDVAVVGGGDTAFEDALYLSGMAGHVFLVHRRDAFRAQPLLVERAKRTENIEFVLDSIPVELSGGESLSTLRVKNAKTGDIRELSVQGVFAAIGYVPDTDFLGELVQRDGAGYIAAGEDCRTSQPGMFAAGDCRTKLLRQVVTAAADGAVAATMAWNYIMERKEK